MMNELQITPSDTVLKFLYNAYHHHLLSFAKLQMLMHEYQNVIKEKVLRFNHGKSTSLSYEDYEKVCQSIDYIFMHGEPEKIIQMHSIKAVLQNGENKIQKDISRIEDTLASIFSVDLHFHNVFFQDVLKQIKKLIQDWRTDEGWLSYGNLNEDFLYPLIDGLAMYHDFYHLNGTDFVLSYSKRLLIECTFCHPFQRSLTCFYQHFLQTTNQKIQDMMINLSELLIRQCIASQILYQQNNINLTSTDIDRLKQMSKHTHAYNQMFINAFHAVFSSSDPQIQLYFESNLSLFTDRKNFFNQLYYNKKDTSSIVIHVKKYGTTTNLNQIIENLQHSSTIEKNMHALLKLDLGVFDWIDLFDQWILSKEEFMHVFQLMESSNLTILWEALKIEYMVQNIEELRQQAIWNETEWISYFCEYIKLHPDIGQKQSDLTFSFE